MRLDAAASLILQVIHTYSKIYTHLISLLDFKMQSKQHFTALSVSFPMNGSAVLFDFTEQCVNIQLAIIYKSPASKYPSYYY